MVRCVRFFALVTTFGLMLSACTWPMFGFGPGHTGVNPVVTNVRTSNVNSFILKGSGFTNGEGFSSPALVHGVVYVGSDSDALYAFDQFGSSATCSGTPKVCTPLWTAPTGGAVESSPAVANGIVYLGSGQPDDKLYAFDAAGGSATCSGTPKTCTPLWTGATGGYVFSSPAVVNGIVYVGSVDGKLYAFDAAGGSATCSGTPKTCTPLWTATTGNAVDSSPAVVNGIVYVGSTDDKVYAFDAAGGSATCSGTPKTCTPLWTATTGGQVRSSPAVANGVVYVGSVDGKLYAFDAAGGSATCSGTPRTCTPLWTAATTPGGIEGTPAVENGIVFIGSDKLYAFDAAGSVNCAGTPKSCTPLWTANTGGSSFSSPGVENGIIFIGGFDALYAFDAAGSMNCAGTPKSCTPLWTATPGGSVDSTPVPAGDAVYLDAGNGNVYAYGLP